MTERLLLHGACADGYHDFSHPPKPFKNMFYPEQEKKAGQPGLYHLRAGLPSDLKIPLGRNPSNLHNPDVLHKEPEMLQELLIGAEPIGTGDYKYSVPDPTQMDEQIIQNLCRAINSSATVDGEKKVRRNINTILGLEQYTIKLLSDHLGNTNINDIQSIQAATSGKHKGRAFRPSKIRIDDLFRFLGSTDINLLFDACSMNMITLFKNALPEQSKQTLNINWLINREFLNDPATKPMNSDSKHTIVGGAQINFRYLIEDSPQTITYTRYEARASSDMLQRNKFFSKMDFKLGPVAITKGDTNPSTRLEVFYNDSLFISDAPNIDNQIGECCGEITAAILSKDPLLASSHYQRKRSGDWLQALSCLDTGRLYYDRDSAKKPESLVNKNVILVTHDRILLWYALMQGLDVLFAGGKGTEDEDDADDEEEASSSSDKLYLLYFSNDKRRLNKADMDKAILETADSLLAKVDALLANIVTFNSNLNEIMEERQRDIDIKFLDIMTTKKTDKIIDLFKEFIKYNSLDYNPADNSELIRTNRDYLAKRSKKNEDSVTAALLFISVFNNFRLRMDTLSTKEAIKTTDNFSRDSHIFKESMPILYEPYEKQLRGRPNPSSLKLIEDGKLAIVKLAAFITTSLNTNMLRQLRSYIDGYEWNDETREFEMIEETDTLNNLLLTAGIDVAATNLNIITTSIISKLDDVMLEIPAAAVVESTIITLERAILDPSPNSPLPNSSLPNSSLPNSPSPNLNDSKPDENTKNKLDIARADLEEKKDAFDIDLFKKLQKKGKSKKPEEAAKLNNLLELRDSINRAEEVLLQAEAEYQASLAANSVSDHGVRGERRNIANAVSLGPVLRSMANKSRSATSGGHIGGGPGDDFKVRLLFVSYINELVSAMNGFDTEENLDYKYFEGLARLVLSHLDSINKTKPNYKNIIQFLYKEIPDGQWSTRGDFATYTATAGKHVSLKAVNMMTGKTPDFGYDVEFYEETTIRYLQYIKITKNLSFRDRHWFYITKLINYLSILPKSSAPVERNFSSQPIEFFQHIHSLSPINLRKLVNESNLTSRELSSFMTAYKRALPMLNKPNVINSKNTRRTVKVGEFGGRRTRRLKKKRQTKRNLKR